MAKTVDTIEAKYFKEVLATINKRGRIWIDNYIDYLNNNMQPQLPDGITKSDAIRISKEALAVYIREIEMKQAFKK